MGNGMSIYGMNSTSTTEDKNSIVFTCSGAIDFSEQVNLELSIEPKQGFTEIQPSDFLKELYRIKHIHQIITTYFYVILGRYPQMSDRNKDIPETKRFTKMYYKCYRKFWHTHDAFGNYKYTDVTLQDAISYIQERNLDIDIPDVKLNTSRDIKLTNLGL